jgi:hypothetical protein
MTSLRIAALFRGLERGDGERHGVGDAGGWARTRSPAGCRGRARRSVGVRSLPLLVDTRPLFGWPGPPPLLASLGLASPLVVNSWQKEAAPTGDPGRWSR